jgi:alpha-beta hydrolase superfamily lysophospholipase
LALKPQKDFLMLPDTFGLHYKTDKIITKDKAELCIWDIAPVGKNQHNRTTLIMAYADMGNMSYYLYYANQFAIEGFRVVMFDYRGFGCSSDFKIDENYLFYTEYVKDLDAVLAYKKKKGGFDKIGVWSSSMGTIIATLANEKFDFMIADSYVTNLDEVVGKIKEMKGKTMSLPVSGNAYVKSIKNNEVPKLVFAGSEDFAIDRNVLNTLKNCTVIDFKGGHQKAAEVFSKNGFADDYTKKIADFLAKTNN